MRAIILLDLMDTIIIDPFFPVLQHLLQRANLEHTDFRACKDQVCFEEFEKGEISEREYMKRFYLPDCDAKIKSRLPEPKKIKKQMFRRPVRYLDGMAALMQSLHLTPGIRLGIASNYSQWYRQITAGRPELENLPDYLFFSSELGVRKPHPDYYELIEQALLEHQNALQSHDIFFSDDREGNLFPAEQRGWQTHTFENAANLRWAITEFLQERKIHLAQV